MLAAVDDVAGKPPETEGELATKIEERADGDEDDAGEEEEFAEATQRVHKEILAEERVYEARARGSKEERFLASLGMKI